MGTQSTETVGDEMIANAVVESVMDMVDDLELFPAITRGALGTSDGITCEVATSSVDSVFLDKNVLFDLDLTFNAKSADLEALSSNLNTIMDSLTRAKTYPSGNGWQIVDISHGSPPIPTVIGRSEENLWIMACAVIVKFYRKDEDA